MSQKRGVAGPYLPQEPCFATTHWSDVLAAGGLDESPRAREALEKLCRIYWYPLYAYVRRNGYGPEEAQDLTQSFFARVIERRELGTASQNRGRFRSFLLTAMKHFLVDHWRRGQAEKRGGGRLLIPLDEMAAEERYQLEPADPLSPDRIYERRWALTVLDCALKQLKTDYEDAGNGRLFQELKGLLSDEPDRPSQADIAASLAMSENAVKQAFHRLRRRYRELLRNEIAQTVTAPGDIEDELRCLVAALRI